MMVTAEFDLAHLVVLSPCCEQPLGYNSEDELFQCPECGKLTEYGMKELRFVGHLSHLELSVDKVESSLCAYSADGFNPRAIVECKNGTKYVLKAEKVKP